MSTKTELASGWYGEMKSSASLTRLSMRVMTAGAPPAMERARACICLHTLGEDAAM